MKKALIAAALISGLTISTGAFAYQGMGGAPMMAGCGYSQGLDPEIKEKVDQFHKDTQDLRKQMIVKKAEKKAMMKRTNPDPAAVGQLTGEIFDLHTTMVEKAKEAGVEQYVGHGKRHHKSVRKGCGGAGYGKGHGHRGYGHGHKGYHHNMPMNQPPAGDQI